MPEQEVDGGRVGAGEGRVDAPADVATQPKRCAVADLGPKIIAGVPETHDERAERMVRAVKNGIRAALLRAKAPPSTWPDAMLTVTEYTTGAST